MAKAAISSFSLVVFGCVVGVVEANGDLMGQSVIAGMNIAELDVVTGRISAFLSLSLNRSCEQCSGSDCIEDFHLIPVCCGTLAL